MIGKHSMMFSHLEKNVIADITYAEYAHTKRVCKGFKIKRLIDYTTNYRYVKASNKYMKNYEKNKEPSYLKWWHKIICIDGQRHKSYSKLIVSGLKKHLNLINILWKNIAMIVTDVQYPENLYNLHNDLPFSPQRMKIWKIEKLVANLHDREEYLFT